MTTSRRMKRRLSSHEKGKVPPSNGNGILGARIKGNIGFVDKKMVVPMKRLHMSLKIFVLIVIAIVSVQIYLALNVPGLSTDNSSDPDLPPQQEYKQVPDECILPNETVIAISRAKTQRCKNEFKELACAIQAGTVYPTEIISSCPLRFDVSVAGTKLGCYQDSTSARILSGSLEKFRDNRPEKCISYCGENGFEYAGVQYSVECFCGNSLKDHKQLLDSSCNRPCPGDKKATCGGYLAMEIYLTGNKAFVPPKLAAEYDSPGDTNDNVGVVFILTLNGRALQQVLRLMSRLDGPGSYFLIHVDARQSYMYEKMAELTKHRNNVRMAETRFTTIWGGSSLLTMLLTSIEQLLLIKEWKWDFVLNLSESDYPVKTRKNLFEFLSANKKSNFVKSHGRQLATFIKKQGLDRTFYQCEDRMWRLGTRQMPEGIQWDGGSDWICLNRDFSEYVVNSNDSLISDLKSFFNLTLLPAESFFHVALRNSRYCGSYMNNNLHLTNWNRKQGCKCQYKNVVDWCGCSPNDFLKEDWHKIEATRAKQLFFARKFEPIIQAEILNKIDAWLELEPWPNQTSYWQSVYSRDHDRNKQSSEFFMLFNFLSKHFLKNLEIKHLVRREFQHVKEVILYKQHDVLDSIIVHVKTLESTEDRISDLQIRIRLEDHLIEDARLTHLSAGTDFDPKEQVFRNFIRLVTTRTRADTFRGRAVFTGGKTNETYEFSWLNPEGRLVAVNSVDIDANPVIAELDMEGGIVNADESSSETAATVFPLMPGIWQLVCTHRGNLLYSHAFLVLPNYPVNGMKDDNNASENNVDRSLTHKHNADLQSFLVNNVPKFYNVTDYCFYDAESKPCIIKPWSYDLNRFNHLVAV